MLPAVVIVCATVLIVIGLVTWDRGRRHRWSQEWPRELWPGQSVGRPAPTVAVAIPETAPSPGPQWTAAELGAPGVLELVDFSMDGEKGRRKLLLPDALRLAKQIQTLAAQAVMEQGPAAGIARGNKPAQGPATDPAPDTVPGPSEKVTPVEARS